MKGTNVQNQIKIHFGLIKIREKLMDSKIKISIIILLIVELLLFVLWYGDVIDYHIHKSNYDVVEATVLSWDMEGSRRNQEPISLIEYSYHEQIVRCKFPKDLFDYGGRKITVAVNKKTNTTTRIYPPIHFTDIIPFIMPLLFWALYYSAHTGKEIEFHFRSTDKCTKIINATVLKVYQSHEKDSGEILDYFAIKCEYINSQGKRYIFRSKKIVGVGKLKKGDKISVKVNENNYHNYIVLLDNEHLY